MSELTLLLEIESIKCFLNSIFLKSLINNFISMIKMKVFPQIVKHGRDEEELEIQNIDLPTLQHKKSMTTSLGSMANSLGVEGMVNYTNATISSPPILGTQYSFKKQDKQCRICLQSSAQSDKLMVKLCKCSGSVQYIHEQCFKSWVEKSLTLKTKQQAQKILKKKQIECEMCKYKIKVSFIDKVGFASCEKISKHIKHKPKLFVLIIVIFLIVFSGLGYVIYELSNIKSLFDKKNNTLVSSIIMICSLILLVILLLMDCLFLFDEYLLTHSIVIDQVKKKEDRPTLSLSRKISNSDMNNPQSPLHFVPPTRNNISSRRYSQSPNLTINDRQNLNTRERARRKSLAANVQRSPSHLSQEQLIKKSRQSSLFRINAISYDETALDSIIQ